MPCETLGQVSVLCSFKVCIDGLLCLSLNHERSQFTVIIFRIIMGLLTVRDSLWVARLRRGRKGSYFDFEMTLEHSVTKGPKHICPFMVLSLFFTSLYDFGGWKDCGQIFAWVWTQIGAMAW